MLILRVIAVVFLVAGFGIVLEAKNIVKKFELDKKTKCDFEYEMSEQELLDYKNTSAMVKVKMIGLLVAIPGLILMVIAFK